MHIELLPALLQRSMVQRAAMSSPCRINRGKVGTFAPNLVKLLKSQIVSALPMSLDGNCENISAI